MADIPADLLVLVTRDRRAGQRRGAVDGTRERRTTLNIYTQVLDGSVRAATENVQQPLFKIVHNGVRSGAELTERGNLPPVADSCDDERDRASDAMKIGEIDDPDNVAVCRSRPRLGARKGQEKGKVPFE